MAVKNHDRTAKGVQRFNHGIDRTYFDDVRLQKAVLLIHPKEISQMIFDGIVGIEGRNDEHFRERFWFEIYRDRIDQFAKRQTAGSDVYTRCVQSQSQRQSLHRKPLEQCVCYDLYTGPRFFDEGHEALVDRLRQGRLNDTEDPLRFPRSIWVAAQVYCELADDARDPVDLWRKPYCCGNRRCSAHSHGGALESELLSPQRKEFAADPAHGFCHGLPIGSGRIAGLPNHQARSRSETFGHLRIGR
ncbi:hypothetical protein ACVWXN_006939 [Bradyrhizobium sp. i1.4.4]